jgi:hypothetical protein
MNKKTRFFVMGSALVLVVGLCTGLLAYYGGLPTLASSRVAGPEELKYVPADAAIVAFANVRDVMASEFRQSLHQVLPGHDQHAQDRFQQETGIDIEHDIDHVVACSGPVGASDNQGFVILKGRFDASRLEALARKNGAQVQEFHNARLVRVPHGGATDATVLAFVEPGLLMFGAESPVKRALAQVDSNVTSNDEMMGMIADVDEGNANLWAVGRMETFAKQTQLPEQIASQLPGVKWFSASSRIDGGLSGTLRAEAMDDEAAKNLREVVQGFLALAKLQAGKQPEVQTVLQSIQLSGSGRTVALSFQVPSEFIQTIANKTKPAIE